MKNGSVIFVFLRATILTSYICLIATCKRISAGLIFAGMNDSLETEDEEERLLHYLFSRYNPRLRPVLKKTDAVTVTFGISLHQIIDVV